MKKCANSGCTICPRMAISNTIYNRRLLYQVMIPNSRRPPITCSSKRVTYAIKCAKSRKVYVGITIRTLRERISEHIANSRKNRDNKKHHSPL